MLSFSLAGRALSALALTLGLAGLTGCGGVYAPGRSAAFELDAAAQIDDEDIRKAYEARPQLPGEMHVAYYCFDPEVAKDLEATLTALPGVASVYRIPPLMITGERRVEEERGWGPPREVTVKKLRLFAARAHADVLVVADHGYKTGGPNGLAAFDVLLVPALFLPMLDNRVDGYAEAFVIDVRNGYLYGHVTEEDKRGPRYATIYEKGKDEIAAEQWQTLRDGLKNDLGRLVAEERTRAKEPRAGEPVAAKGERPAAP
jgi:hypothetical protein